MSGTIRVIAQLNHKLMPIDRGDRYEDPLDEELAKIGFGNTASGGTMLNNSKEIDFIDIEMNLLQTDKSIPFVIERLEAYGAPKGSKLIIGEAQDKREIPFGKAEGVGIYLNGTTLPEKVYDECDVNQVISEINKLVFGHGEIQAYWEGSTETALYIYGDDAELMKKLLARYIASYPLCEGARVTTLTPQN
jgi:hypothetical protein